MLPQQLTLGCLKTSYLKQATGYSPFNMMTMTRNYDFFVGNTTELIPIDGLNLTTEYVGTVESTTDYYDYNDFLEELGTCDYGRPATFYLPALYSLLFILGLPINVLVVWVIVAGVRLRSMTDVCLLNLAIADLLLLSSLPFLAHQARGHWSFGDAMCKVVLGTYHVGFYAGIFFITLMSVDRYLAIVHAISARKMRTRSFGVLAAVVTWVAGLLASFPEVGFLNEQRSNNTTFCAPSYGNTSGDISSNWWRVFGLLKMNILGLVIPFVFMTFCYSQIVRTLLSCQTSKRQAIRLIALVVCVFFCCWLPYNVTCFFYALELIGSYTSCNRSRHIQMVLQVTEVIAYCHSCINPMLYVFVGERFRRQLLKLISRSPCMLWPVVRRCIPSQDRLRSSMYSQSTSLNERPTVV
ncbi:unnamed protein product [Arctogadus glacialis]